MIHSGMTGENNDDADVTLGFKIINYLFYFDVIISKDFFTPEALGPGKEKQNKTKNTQISFVQVFEIRNLPS